MWPPWPRSAERKSLVYSKKDSCADDLISYKPDVKVGFLTEELAFSDDQQCAQFLFDIAGEQMLEDRPDGPRFLTGKAGQVFEVAKAKTSRVDLKGQK